MKTFSNRDMAGLIGCGLVNARKWTFRFLGEDENAGQQDGRSRSIAENDAWRVFLGAQLMMNCGFTLDEATKILPIAYTWLDHKGLVPGKQPPVDAPAKRFELRIYRIHIDIPALPGFAIVARCVVGRRSVKPPATIASDEIGQTNFGFLYEDHYFEEYVSKHPASIPVFPDRLSCRIIDITEARLAFDDRVKRAELKEF